MLAEKLQIYRDLTTLGRELLKNNRNVDKFIRYGIWQEMLCKTCEALDLVVVANSSQETREATLNQTLIILGGIRSRSRMLLESKQVTVQMAVNLQYLIDKIYKQATGWRNNSHSQSRNTNGETGEHSLLEANTGRHFQPSQGKSK